jgi:hypothetical protein
MSTDFQPQDDSGNFTGSSWRGRLAILLMLSVVATVLIVTALSFEFLAEELAKVYVVPMMITAMFVSLTSCVMLYRFRSEELY